MDYIVVDKYRQLFSDHVEQALDYVKNLREEDFKAKVNKRAKLFRFHVCLNDFSQPIRRSSYFQLYEKSVLSSGVVVLDRSRNCT